MKSTLTRKRRSGCLIGSHVGIAIPLSHGNLFFEHEAKPETFRSLFDSLWWAIATLTTVGYGDVYPITVGGRPFTFVVLICGLGIVAMPAGLVAAALLRIRHDENRA